MCRTFFKPSIPQCSSSLLMLQIGWRTPSIIPSDPNDNHGNYDEDDEEENEIEREEIERQRERERDVVSDWTMIMRAWWINRYEAKTIDDIILRLVEAAPTTPLAHYFLHDRYASESIRSLRRYHETGEYSDITIATTSGFIFRGHLSVLDAHTDFFSVCSRGDWLENSDGKSVTLDCEAESLSYLLKYFYFGELDTIPVDSLISCLTLSHQLMSPSLSQRLERLIAPLIDSENVCCLLELSNTYQFPLLKERCLIIAIDNLENIRELDYFRDLTPSVQAALQSLCRSYHQSKSLYGDTFHYLRELLSMIKDSLQEAEEVYSVSLRRNEMEVRECEELLRGQGIEFDPLQPRTQSNDMSISSVFLSTWSTINNRRSTQTKEDLLDWRYRLESVSQTLRNQRKQLDQRKEFYDNQKKSLDVFYEMDGSERLHKDDDI